MPKRKPTRAGLVRSSRDVRADPRGQPYFDIAQIRRPNAVFEVLADAIRLLADALRVGRITPDQLAERLLKIEGAVRGRAR